MGADGVTLRNPVDQVRIRSGQRKLIFATARRIGLRDEQLHDLIENMSDFRTRAIAHLTLGEARRLIGLLKTIERGGRRGARSPKRDVPQPPYEDLTVREAIRRGQASA